MGRLTIQTPNGAALSLNNPANEREARKQLMAAYKIAVNKLAAYEDIGTPEEFAAAKKDVGYLTREVSALARESVEREKALAKLEAVVTAWAKAESEGRLVVLPCKVGDKVQICHVTGFGGYVGGGKISLFYQNSTAPFVFMSIGCDDGKIRNYEINAYGKSIIPAEAEAALERG